MIILSAAHDGAFAMVRRDDLNPINIKLVRGELNSVLPEEFEPWSRFLLKQRVSIILKELYMKVVDF